MGGFTTSSSPTSPPPPPAPWPEPPRHLASPQSSILASIRLLTYAARCVVYAGRAGIMVARGFGMDCYSFIRGSVRASCAYGSGLVEAARQSLANEKINEKRPPHSIGKDRLIAFGLGMAVFLTAAISITSCRKSTPVPVNSVQPQSKPQASEVRVMSADEQSCKAFVQRFYDWYWNRFADRIDDPNFQFPGDHDISLQEPPIISKEIFQLIDNYEKRIDNPKTNPDGGNSVLEYWDPYLNSDNGAHGKYLVVQVAVSGARCLATVRGSTNVQPELKKVRQSWLIVNFHYPDAKRKSESSLIDELSP